MDWSINESILMKDIISWGTPYLETPLNLFLSMSSYGFSSSKVAPVPIDGSILSGYKSDVDGALDPWSCLTSNQVILICLIMLSNF